MAKPKAKTTDQPEFVTPEPIETPVVAASVEPVIESAPVDPLQALYVQCDALKAEQIDVQRQIIALQEQDRRLAHKIDRLITQIENEAPKPSKAEPILSYIESSNRARQERHARTMALLTVADPSELVNQIAPIDAALAQSRRRGTNRPQFPATN